MASMAAPGIEKDAKVETLLAEAKKRSISLLKDTADVKGWTPVKYDSIPAGLEVYEKYTEGLITVRGEMVGVMAPAWDVAKWIYSLESLPVLDKLAQVDKARLVQEFNDRSSIMYCPYNVPWPLHPREFLWFQLWQSGDDGTEIISGFSIDKSEIPTTDGYVRGIINDSGYVIRPIGSNTCMVSYVVSINPGGWVPAWANTKTAEQVYGLAYCRDYFESNPIAKTAKPTQSN